ncbi:hypothetical protein MLD63_04815 [Paracoccus sp. TK19116]|uniref:Sulfotransferase domain-containing protein n=1 Tax=Paracoccus albicereus TaxID=2922394 RepID=A0ABT1MN88_9RHOB|nr:hypothetical protein [Paracoccus albicereus]MCQ0969748.1 hypothetical protein [Paracoccus albicereus]
MNTHSRDALAAVTSIDSLKGLPEAEGVDVLIHVGVHKTGTTWLQRELFGKSNEIIFEPSHEPSHKAFLIQPAASFTLDIVREQYGGLLHQARSQGKPLVISDEALGGRAFHQKYYREIAAHRLHAAFPNATILVTVREQRALLSSLYGEYLRYGYSSTLEQFLNRESPNPSLEPTLDFSYYEYDRTQTFYESLFGANKVIVAPMLWTLADPWGLVDRVNRTFSSKLTLPAATTTERTVRPAMSEWARRVLRRMNGLVPQDSRHLMKPSKFSPNSIAYQVDRLTPTWAREKGKRNQKNIVDALVGDYYALSNARFAKMSGIDLKSLGYVVADTV